MSNRSEDEEFLVQMLERVENPPDLIRVLNELVRTHAGFSSHDVERQARQRSLSISRATTLRILKGTQEPRKDQVLTLALTCGISDLEPWGRAWDRVYPDEGGAGGNIVISGSTVHVSQGPAWTQVNPTHDQTPTPDLATQRQGFFFEFLGQALRQAETMFRLSVVFMSGGAAILLTGGVFALINAGNGKWSYLPLLTTLSGLLITTCGGAFALHSNRARKHLTDQAERIHQNIQSDLTLNQALSLIDQVEDVELRDRLKSFTALRVLGLSPEPSEVTERLLPQPAEPRAEMERKK
ncbi:TRADD-N-associated membrane domain-containing protein [Nonomuraea endophytica]|uniref:TRADD-N-associated membrane domain-containing protein n=1 Tax=Nonomuraea endophytica TaxID=714136 RepID=UPI0037C6FB3C